jgi:glycosyltransferase involved in cell wall biosynthesis
MNILHVIPTYVPAYRYGGPVRSVHGLAEAQAASGDRVVVFTTDRDGVGRLDVPEGSPVRVGSHEARYFPVGFPAPLGRSPAMGSALSAEIRLFDIVHLHSVFLWPTRAAARAARRAGKRYVVSPRGMLAGDLIRRRGSLRKRLWIALVERRTLAESSGIVASSGLESEELRALGLDLAQVFEVPNGVDPEELRAPRPEQISPEVAGVVDAGPYALLFGRYSWKKGIGLAIRATSKVPGIRLVCAGPDDEGLRPGLEELAESLGLRDRVRFLPELRGPDRAAILRGARVTLLPSLSENFGNSGLESLACGTPVIVSRGVGLAATVESCDAGWVVDADEAALAGGLEEAFADPDAASEAGARGRRTVLESFSWSVVANRMRAVYEEVLAR